MNKLLIPSIFAALVLVAGVFALIPVQKATTVHTFLSSTTKDQDRTLTFVTYGAATRNTNNTSIFDPPEKITGVVTVAIDGIGNQTARLEDNNGTRILSVTTTEGTKSGTFTFSADGLRVDAPTDSVVTVTVAVQRGRT